MGSSEPDVPPSAEAMAAGHRVNEALDSLCVHGLKDTHGEPSHGWDCSGCTQLEVAREIDAAVKAATEDLVRAIWVAKRKAATQECVEPGCSEKAPPYCARHRGDWNTVPPLPQTQEADRCPTCESLERGLRRRMVVEPIRCADAWHSVTPPSVPSEEPFKAPDGWPTTAESCRTCVGTGRVWIDLGWHRCPDCTPPDEPLDAMTEARKRAERDMYVPTGRIEIRRVGPLDTETEKLIDEFCDRWTAPEGLEEELRDLVRDVRRPVEQRLASAREELAEWPRRFDDAVQPLQLRTQEYITRLEARERQLSEARQALEAAERAMRTRPDYDCRCQDCGAAHNLDTSIPSATWNAICENRPGITPGADGIGMPEVGMLCTLCIDERLGKAGIRCDEAEFYFVGTNLSGKLYTESHGEVARLEREVADLEQRGTGLDEALAQMSARYAHLCDVLVVRDSTWEIHLQAKHARDGWAKRGTR